MSQDEINTTPPRHGLTARILHWATPLLLAYGYFRNGQVTGALQDPAAMSREIWFGAAVLGIFALRFAWMRLFNKGATRLPSSAPRWERVLSKLGHLALYAGVAAIILTGWSIPLALSTGDAFLLDAATGIHESVTNVMLLLIGGHVVAALWHYVVRKDGIWQSMGTPTFGLSFVSRKVQKLSTWMPFAKWRVLR